MKNYLFLFLFGALLSCTDMENDAKIGNDINASAQNNIEKLITEKDDSSETEENDSTEISYGLVRGTVSDNTVTFEWNLDSNCNGFLFVLYSSRLGRIAELETFTNEGRESVTFLSEYVGHVGSLYIEVKSGCNYPTNDFTVSLVDMGGGVYKGESVPKCDHGFSYRDTEIHLRADMYSGVIEGFVGYAKPFAFVMKYSYYDRTRNKTIEGFVYQKFESRPLSLNVKIFWSAAFEISQYYMSELSCEARIYDLSCTKIIPNDLRSFNATGNCTNYLYSRFLTPISSSFEFPSFSIF